jgi:hypothetical protein
MTIVEITSALRAPAATPREARGIAHCVRQGLSRPTWRERRAPALRRRGEVQLDHSRQAPEHGSTASSLGSDSRISAAIFSAQLMQTPARSIPQPVQLQLDLWDVSARLSLITPPRSKRRGARSIRSETWLTPRSASLCPADRCGALVVAEEQCQHPSRQRCTAGAPAVPRRPFDALLARMAASSFFAAAIWPLRFSKWTASIKTYSVRLRERSRGNLGVHGI